MYTIYMYSWREFIIIAQRVHIYIYSVVCAQQPCKCDYNTKAGRGWIEGGGKWKILGLTIFFSNPGAAVIRYPRNFVVKCTEVSLLSCMQTNEFIVDT